MTIVELGEEEGAEEEGAVESGGGGEPPAEMGTALGGVGERAAEKLGKLSVIDQLKQKMARIKGPKKADALVSLLLQVASEEDLVSVTSHLKARLGQMGK